MIHGLILLRGSKRLRRVHSGSRQDVKVQQAATLGGLLANVSKLNNVVAPPPKMLVLGQCELNIFSDFSINN